MFLKKVFGKKVIRRRTWNNTFDPKKMSWRWPEYQGLLGKSQHLAFFPPPWTSSQSCSILISFGQGLTLFQIATKICIKRSTHENSFFSNNCVFFSLFWPKKYIIKQNLPFHTLIFKPFNFSVHFLMFPILGTNLWFANIS